MVRGGGWLGSQSRPPQLCSRRAAHHSACLPACLPACLGPTAAPPSCAACLRQNRWESSGYFKPDESAAGEPYIISMPPPNVTGKLHMGHAMFVTLQASVGACAGAAACMAARKARCDRCCGTCRTS